MDYYNEIETLVRPVQRWHRVRRIEFGGNEQPHLERARLLVMAMRIFARVRKALGPRGLTVREFSPGALKDGDVVSDFFHAMGELTGRQVAVKAPDSTANPSLSAEECIVLQELKRAQAIDATPQSRLMNRKINASVARAARGVELTKLRFLDEIGRLIDNHHHAEIRLLREQLGIDFGVSIEAPDDESVRRLRAVAAKVDIADLVVHDLGRLEALRGRALHILNRPAPG